MATRRWYNSGRPLDRFIRYCLVGGINTATDFSIFIVLTSLAKLGAAPANVVSYTTALCVSFVLNRNFTFRSSAYSLLPGAQFYRFVAVNLVCLASSTAAVWLLAPTIGAIPAKVVVTPFVTLWGFLAARLVVFAAKV